MGGCRCYFRNCHVTSTKFPGTHFFHFPIKDAERYKKWREYSQMDQMLEFSAVRRRNTSICARHFRFECFMNYKMVRLTGAAVPTLMRLSEDKALDFELDIEHGVLVNMEKPKEQHLLPPDGFVCPLFLKNDKILQEKLNELQSKQHDVNEHVELIDFEQKECEELSENPSKTLAYSVEISTDVQAAAPSLKRSTQILNSEKVVGGKKCRILNAQNCTGGNDVKKLSTVSLAPVENDEDESGDIHIVGAIEMESEFLSEEEQLFLTNESFTNDDCDEDIEIFQVYRNENDLHIEPSLSDSDETIVQLKKSPENTEDINIDKRLLEFDQIKQDFDALYVKYTILETENKELKKNCQLTDQMRKHQLLLQVENNNLKETLKDFDSVKEKLHKCIEENHKLKTETVNIKALKTELVSGKEEIKELKKLLETSRNVDSKRETIELEIKNKDIHVLQKNLELLQQQLNDTIGELKEIQTNLNNVENENKRLIIQENKLKKSLEDAQNNFDLKQTDYNAIKSNFEELQLKQSALEQKYWKLQELQSQEATVTTSLGKDRTNTATVVPSEPSISVPSLTKAQLYNGIKRYLCSSMVSLLRMEMFGSTEREWKPDERQVAVDILRLGEIAYRYFTDEWRIRLPALRDTREWLSQSQQLMEDEDL